MSAVNRPAWFKIGIPTALLLFGVGVLAFWQHSSTEPESSDRDTLQEARDALRSKDYDLAEQLAASIPTDDPDWSQAQLVAGEAAQMQGDLQRAGEYYRSVPRDGSRIAILAAFQAGDIDKEIGRLTAAEEAFRYHLSFVPDDPATHERMAFLLGVTGRRWESGRHFFSLAQSDSSTYDELAHLGDLERPMEQYEYLQRCYQNAPDDIIVRLGLAADSLAKGNAQEARQALRKIVHEQPDLVAAHALLGELVVDESDSDFVRWYRKLPDAAFNHPNVWFVCGRWAKRQGDLKVAARCFWETALRAPTHRRGIYELSQVLVALQESSGDEFAVRANRMFELSKRLDDALRCQATDEVTVKRIVDLLEGMGRLWEARAWAMMSAEIFPRSAWPPNVVRRLSKRLTPQTPRTIDQANLAKRFDFSDYPDLSELLREIKVQPETPIAQQLAHHISFDEKLATGVDFTYWNAHDPSTVGARLQEQTGGGVAVLDFDGDEWPDLYFTQGANWPTGSETPTPDPGLIDRLFRNQRGQSFTDITELAHLHITDFGQGCAVGDFNGDGFPDLYVANIGRNRLLRNNGDGTFSDISDQIGIEASDWTVSVAMTDLNGDTFPDLFDVNYLTGKDVYTLICDGKACSPRGFPGTPDRVLLSRGNGRFQNLDYGANIAHAKGLGVVVMRLNQNRLPSLFVANDQVPNFLFHCIAGKTPQQLQLKETAFASGVGFNEDGLATACMGIAAGDVDRNGNMDLLVTNYFNEANTLFLQRANGIFSDGTTTSELFEPSRPFVGWGAQFLDADLNGTLDLVLTNGHVDDFQDQGARYKMRPQFFQNLNRGTFAELTAEQLGPFFTREYLGRGLARLDWNGDGRMDFAVSHMRDPAAIVTNTTTGAGHFINFRLHATTTARDAIGTEIDVETSVGRWSSQLVAGDGYMASNERMLQFGLGSAEFVSRVQITWPSGAVSVLEDLRADRTIELTEGSRTALAWIGRLPFSRHVDQVLPPGPPQAHRLRPTAGRAPLR